MILDHYLPMHFYTIQRIDENNKFDQTQWLCRIGVLFTVLITSTGRSVIFYRLFICDFLRDIRYIPTQYTVRTHTHARTFCFVNKTF